MHETKKTKDFYASLVRHDEKSFARAPKAKEGKIIVDEGRFAAAGERMENRPGRGESGERFEEVKGH